MGRSLHFSSRLVCWRNARSKRNLLNLKSFIRYRDRFLSSLSRWDSWYAQHRPKRCLRGSVEAALLLCLGLAAFRKMWNWDERDKLLVKSWKGLPSQSVKALGRRESTTQLELPFLWFSKKLPQVCRFVVRSVHSNPLTSCTGTRPSILSCDELWLGALKPP